MPGIDVRTFDRGWASWSSSICPQQRDQQPTARLGYLCGEALEGIIAAKADGKPLPAEGGKREQGEVVDLMATLNASVAVVSKSRGEYDEDAPVAEDHPESACEEGCSEEAQCLLPLQQMGRCRYSRRPGS
ncbi:hypothetical protein [Streptomyces anulatus]|uniref:hypothetical protein n=1 Tax=Streptomyces anulatus TaxID=1892 RepID=UPI0036C9891D